MSFQIDGITEDSLKNCKNSESATTSTTTSTTASTTTPATSKAIETASTTLQQSTAIFSTTEMSILESEAPISSTQQTTLPSLETKTQSSAPLATTTSRVATETAKISTTTSSMTTETSTIAAADIPKTSTVPQDDSFYTLNSETTTTILDIINPRKIGANNNIVMYNDEQLHDDLTTMSPMKENNESNIVDDNLADKVYSVEANDYVDIDLDAIATTQGIIQEVRRF